MRRRSVVRGLLSLVALVLAVSACRATPPPEDASLDGKLDQLTEARTPARLADLTDFDWDEAFFFDSYTSADEVNSTAGGRILESWRGVGENENLLVFDLDGVPVRIARDGKNLTRTNQGPGSDVLTREVVAYPRCGSIYLLAPDDSPPSPECRS